MLPGITSADFVGRILFWKKNKMGQKTYCTFAIRGLYSLFGKEKIDKKR